MSQVNTMEYVAEFQRGWPVAEPTLEMNLPVSASYGAAQAGNGDLVVLASDGIAIAGATTDAVEIGIVARGPRDRRTNSVGTGGTATPAIVLFGNYVVRTTNIETGATVGAAIPVKGTAVGVSANGKWAAVDGTLTVKRGFCTDVSDVFLADGTAAKSATIVVR
jgi:hypothetical protein